MAYARPHTLYDGTRRPADRRYHCLTAGRRYDDFDQAEGWSSHPPCTRRDGKEVVQQAKQCTRKRKHSEATRLHMERGLSRSMLPFATLARWLYPATITCYCVWVRLDRFTASMKFTEAPVLLLFGGDDPHAGRDIAMPCVRTGERAGAAGRCRDSIFLGPRSRRTASPKLAKNLRLHQVYIKVLYIIFYIKKLM